MTEKEKTQLQKYLNRYVFFEKNELEIIFNSLETTSLKKKDFILKKGEKCQHQYFILNGMIRFFYEDKDGIAHTFQFGIENWWFTNYESFTLKIASEDFIQCIENTKLARISKTNLEQLFDRIPKLEKVFRIIAENTLIAVNRRNRFFMDMDGKEKYEFLMQSIPDISQRIPQYMIASYLQMTPEYLSNLRKKSIS
ncbi:Crp/Fnr family transcriptional regulator [Aureivirga marina]|uniref:Crp/Fnr family transcriptional regulator n=1 Tax=Aureivirga marina TaxID=1182451 RepID=UPI0018C9D0D6|nr:cyclic nucleotide-binding domain-containing protein [Aureivirga marina]